MDETLSYDDHVKKVCKSSFFHLRNISRIRKYLTEKSVEVIIHALITTKLDYCNSLMYGLPKRLPSNGVNWYVGVNWDRILVNHHLCYCSLRDTGGKWDKTLVHCDPCDCVLMLI